MKNILQYKNYAVKCVRLMAGLMQPPLARVRLIRLWGWVRLHTCGPSVIMAPRINQLSPSLSSVLLHYYCPQQGSVVSVPLIFCPIDEQPVQQHDVC